MKSLFSKAMVLLAGAAAFLGISVANVNASAPFQASVKGITSKSALYLEHGKQINNSIGTESWHGSHGSHGSHESGTSE